MGRGQAGAKDLPVDIELFVFHPAGVIDIKGSPRQLALQHGRRFQPPFNLGLEGFEEIALIAVRQLEHGQ